MPRPSSAVDIKPAVLKWARESSGWTVDEIAKKLKVSSSEYEEWESTGQDIKLKHLEALSKHYKRSLAVFFLPNPPPEPRPPRDFRLLPGRQGKFERKTLFAIRRGTRLQNIAANLFDNLEEIKEPKIGTVSKEENAEIAALRQRQLLGISMQEQINWRDESEALTGWRDRIERMNILVFSQRMPVDDARGFSLTENLPWVIVINSSDSVRARIFTLFHEYGHLLLRSPGVCIPQREWVKRARFEETERWCNKFAAALLLPKDAFAHAVGMMPPSEPLHELTHRFSRTYKVSQEVVLRRLMSLNLLAKKEFWEQLARLRLLPQQKKKKGFVPPALASVRGRGKHFTRLVLEGREKGVLTYKDVADFLSIRLKHLEKVSSLVEM